MTVCGLVMHGRCIVMTAATVQTTEAYKVKDEKGPPFKTTHENEVRCKCQVRLANCAGEE